MVAKSYKFGMVGGAVVLLGLSPALANLFDSGHRVSLSTSDPALRAVSTILQQSCADCHAPEVAKMPFYASLPPAKGIVSRDQQTAERWWRLRPARLEGKTPFDSSDWGQIELAIEQGSMPPPEYLALHWNAGVSGKEAATLKDWIANVRSKTPEAQKMAAKHRGEAIQPLVLPAGLDAAKVALGDRLYHENRLSGDGSLSCASCHALNKGGTDQSPVSTGIRGQKGPINAPTTLNAGYNVLQFWDGRAKDLKEQAGGPVENPKEMGAKFSDVVPKLQQDPAYAELFKAVYGGRGISKDTITDAIAEFERSLVTVGSAFDRYLGGDDGAIDATTKAGYALFKSVGCAACHAGPAVGGSSFQTMGLAADYFSDRGHPTDADLGRFSSTRDPKDKHAFKVPTLRNLTVTFPYFHDASAETMDQAIVAMAKYQRGQSLKPEQIQQLAAFLRSLTGTYQGKPVDKL